MYQPKNACNNQIVDNVNITAIISHKMNIHGCQNVIVKFGIHS